MIGNLELIERGLLESSTTPMREAAHSEFAKLRMAIDEAHHAHIYVDSRGVLELECERDVGRTLDDADVLLVKCDE